MSNLSEATRGEDILYCALDPDGCDPYSEEQVAEQALDKVESDLIEYIHDNTCYGDEFILYKLVPIRRVTLADKLTSV